ncbi:N-acetylmuramoyl-L-alanine amidase [Anaerophilus nitritogenes]|uniref:N-acetylmuramoyl-L-alanine amidase n=1 Tax=Anaerophilus nitritogenes TaxID=2498136 RepID=UPI0013EA54D7|nr:N-acetylmuramoyl-L-alanine amidase [Anaerophilus nitritogenes]
MKKVLLFLFTFTIFLSMGSIAFGEEMKSSMQVKNQKVETVNKVHNIKIEKINLVDAVVIQTEETPTYNRMDIGNRIVVDVLNASLKMNQKEMHISQLGIEKIKMTEFASNQNYEKQDKVVRIVLYLDSVESAENVCIDQEGKDIIIYTSQKPVKQLHYEKENNNIIFPTKNNTGKKMIVVDPGHGGKAPGTHSENPLQYEKDLALDTAKRLEKLLQEVGYDTYMTRSDDITVGLSDRANAANIVNADLFVSVHYNWFDDPKVSGVQTLYVDNDPRDNKVFAKIMQEELVKGLDAKDMRIVDRPNLVVIRDTKMPAVLCEIAFLSNPEEVLKVSTQEYRQRAAQAMLNGITRYLNQ